MLPEWARRARAGWKWTGSARPPWAAVPGPDEESVWDYPRPPALDPVDSHVVVRLDGELVAETTGAVRILETSHPPSYYLPRSDVIDGLLASAPGSSGCEWKGLASYWDVRTGGGRVEERGAWSYEDPFPEYVRIRGHVSFYPARFECFVDGDLVEPQAGGFYGGWVTPGLAGPFKGQPGSAGW